MAAPTVADVLMLPVVMAANPRILAGRAGLDRPVRWVHTTELVDVAPLLRGGDLVFTTGIALPDADDALVEFARSIDTAGAAGLVVELGRRWTAVPTSLVEACAQRGLPLAQLHRQVRFAEVAQVVGERIVDAQAAELREAHRVHDLFTDLAMAEADAHQILDAVHRLAGATVVWEGRDHSVLDYRTTPGADPDFLADWARRSRSVELEARTQWDADLGWLVARVGRRERGWGRLVVHSATPPQARLIAVAERGATALALHRFHDDRRSNTARRNHHALFAAMVDDPTDPAVGERAEITGFPLDGRWFVGLSLLLPGTTTGGGPALDDVDDVVAAVLHAAHAARTPAVVSESDRLVRMVLSAPGADVAEAAVDRIAAAAHAAHDVLVAAGRPVRRVAHLDRTIRESQQVVLSADPSTRSPRVHRLEDVHLRGVLAMMADDDRLRLFAERELSELLEADRARGTDLVGAVRALLAHPASKSRAAESLHMSRPVFYDRIRRAEKVIGGSLDDPERRVSLQVALMIADLHRSGAELGLPLEPTPPQAGGPFDHRQR